MSDAPTVVTFNGTNLTDLYRVSDLRTSLLPRNVGTLEVPGMDGAAFTGVTMAPRTITLTLTVREDTAIAREEAARTLAATLAVDEPKRLHVSTYGVPYWMAIPTQESDAARYLNATSFDVDFIAPDPVMYGMGRIAAGSSSPSFTVGGTYPTAIGVSVPRATGDANGIWRARFDTGEYIQVDLGDSAEHAIRYMADERTLTVDGENVMLPMETDWAILEPGDHRLTIEAGGAAGGMIAVNVSYTERWL